MPAHIEWVGHACFRIRRDGGPAIVTDPAAAVIPG